MTGEQINMFDFADPILTRPGENLIETVAAARKYERLVEKATAEVEAAIIPGTVLRDVGIERAAKRADRESPSWTERALEHFREYAVRCGEPFLTEQVRQFAEANGFPAPDEPRAWGGIPTMAKKRGYVKHAGYAQAKNASSHAGPRSLWVRA